MELFLVVISIVLFAFYLKERNKSKKMESDYKYINSRLRDITNDDEINYILVPSDISIVKETAVDINKLLESFTVGKLIIIEVKKRYCKYLQTYHTIYELPSQY